jgi:hypothetical protein
MQSPVFAVSFYFSSPGGAMRRSAFIIIAVCLATGCAQPHSRIHDTAATVGASDFEKGEPVYENSLANRGSVKDWVMEGPGELEFRDGWMEMYSPEEKYHHVFWCPADFPDSFVAEWEAQNLHNRAGLCIVFFAAGGVNGKDVFDPSFPARNGRFSQYTKGPINSYHISYHANAPNEPGRDHANLRKNSGFHLVQEGNMGIPADSEQVHKLRLVKDGPRIVMFVDGRVIIDWTDDGETFGPALGGGKIGFRQMKWTRFRYRNFKVWGLGSE